MLPRQLEYCQRLSANYDSRDNDTNYSYDHFDTDAHSWSDGFYFEKAIRVASIERFGKIIRPNFKLNMNIPG
ncbi:MAG: hypothetical protein AUJ04_08980 [Acidobacteria bacterium 13_1_40CM_3_55_6]|nr:MAG: hypothetical protein AUJ04_08980 [Acidobacteria bacterium 13_1_40CM_3_55_6]